MRNGKQIWNVAWGQIDAKCTWSLVKGNFLNFLHNVLNTLITKYIDKTNMIQVIIYYLFRKPTRKDMERKKGSGTYKWAEDSVINEHRSAP